MIFVLARGWTGLPLLATSLPAFAGEPSIWGAGFQTLLGLGIVLALIVGTSVFLKRLNPGRLGRNGLLKPITTVAVGPRERIIVVELGDTWMVVGVTANQITPLHIMAKGTFPESAEPIAPSQNSSGPTPFSRLLSRIQER